ncbi:MAG: GNAT family N-acyltransferase [Verrucomicrobiota bacterium]|nr:GNAT family N-acetyltransferase [Limisphaera sp.]MDW8381653.1 GNAT family N-acyltransferase [Verrucomicrobiota bacterium]
MKLEVHSPQWSRDRLARVQIRQTLGGSLEPSSCAACAWGPRRYHLRLAETSEEVRAALRLRFEVFNLELCEGVVSSYQTGLDEDSFDAVCDHLIVVEEAQGCVVGTYRLQTARMAARHRGFYSAQEFDLSGWERTGDDMIELGRACVAKEHRNLTVLGMLWRGIVQYAVARGGRYLFGCSSLHTRDEKAGAFVYAELCRRYLAPFPWRARPHPWCECGLGALSEAPFPIPRLLRAYLDLGAKICGPPAIDREFGTIDFLTWLDLYALPESLLSRWLSGPEAGSVLQGAA